MREEKNMEREKQITHETLLALFSSLAGNKAPVRMDRREAMRYVNRKSEMLFDAFLEQHGIQTFTYGANGKREYYTHELAEATLNEYANIPSTH